MKDRETIVSHWVCGFMFGFRADLVMFFMLFRVGFMSVMLGALNFIAMKTAEHHRFLCVLSVLHPSRVKFA